LHLYSPCNDNDGDDDDDDNNNNNNNNNVRVDVITLVYWGLRSSRVCYAVIR
jgi:hypothetical protein